MKTNEKSIKEYREEYGFTIDSKYKHPRFGRMDICYSCRSLNDKAPPKTINCIHCDKPLCNKCVFWNDWGFPTCCKCH